MLSYLQGPITIFENLLCHLSGYDTRQFCNDRHSAPVFPHGKGKTHTHQGWQMPSLRFFVVLYITNMTMAALTMFRTWPPPWMFEYEIMLNLVTQSWLKYPLVHNPWTVNPDNINIIGEKGAVSSKFCWLCASILMDLILFDLQKHISVSSLIGKCYVRHFDVLESNKTW